MSLTSWGMYPKTKNTVLKFDKEKTLKKIINDYNEIIPYGLSLIHI